jgi:acyl-CoA thioesterase FadM
MPDYRFFHPIEIRYGDLDPQGHVNNAKYLTYMEQARVQYMQQLGLWDGGSFMEIGIILAEARLTFRAPVRFGQAVRAGARVSRTGLQPGRYRLRGCAGDRCGRAGSLRLPHRPNHPGSGRMAAANFAV